MFLSSENNDSHCVNFEAVGKSYENGIKILSLTGLHLLLIGWLNLECAK